MFGKDPASSRRVVVPCGSHSFHISWTLRILSFAPLMWATAQSFSERRGHIAKEPRGPNTRTITQRGKSTSPVWISLLFASEISHPVSKGKKTHLKCLYCAPALDGLLHNRSITFSPSAAAESAHKLKLLMLSSGSLLILKLNFWWINLLALCLCSKHMHLSMRGALFSWWWAWRPVYHNGKVYICGRTGDCREEGSGFGLTRGVSLVRIKGGGRERGRFTRALTRTSTFDSTVPTLPSSASLCGQQLTLPVVSSSQGISELQVSSSWSWRFLRQPVACAM